MIFKITGNYLQNTHEKVQLQCVTNTKLFLKREASNSTYQNLTKYKKYHKLNKSKHQGKLHNYEKPNILKKISIGIAQKLINIKGSVMQIEKAPIHDRLRFQKYPESFAF